MTADRLATLARRAAADPGDAQAQAAWLRARVQAGERGPVACSRCSGRGYQVWASGAPEPVTYEDCPDCNGTGLAPFRLSVELAAYCGHASSMLALGCEHTPGGWIDETTPRAPTYALDFWLNGLARWGDEVMVRAAVAAARLVILGSEYCKCGGCGCPVCCDCGKRTAPLLAIKAAEAYLSDPSEESLKKRRRIWDRVNIGDGAPLWAPWGEEDGRVRGPIDRITNAVREAGEQPVREAIQRALIEWALR